MRIAGAIVWACLGAAAAGAADRPADRGPLARLDPFYRQHVLVDGLLIASSEKVSARALDEVAYLVRKLLADRPDVLKALVDNKVYVGVMAYNEMTRAIPEHRKLSPWYDKRARGLGGNPVTCAEENLLAFRGDPYRGESIFIHEFAHIIHSRGLAAVDKTFDERLRALFEQARKAGRFSGYGMTSHGEFWAEGVQSWFHCNRAGGLAVAGAEGKPRTQIHTRKQLREHLPAFARLLDESFGGNAWTYVPVAQRLGRDHLEGYDPAKAPAFAWPKAVLEAARKIEAERAREKRRRN